MRTRFTQIGTAAVVAASLAMPALAQTSSGTNNTSAATSAPSSHDEVRTSKLVGSTVYNDQNQSVGTVDDILLTHDTKQPVQAVISVGGFLGIGAKLVTVPYNRLQFEAGNKVVLPNASRDELKNMQSFSYNTLDHSGTTNASGSTASDATASGTTASGTGVGAPGAPTHQSPTTGSTNR